MSSILSNLKKKRSEQAALVTKSIEEGAKGNRTVDERLYKVKLNEKGEFNAIVRILPDPSGNDLPWKPITKYGFKGPTGKNYYNNSPRTNNQPCPVADYNYRMWGTGEKAAQEDCKLRKQSHRYYMNIYVIRDPQTPENEGKVFIVDWGKQLFSLIEAQVKPEVDELTGSAPEPCFVYDVFEGKNLRIKAYGKKLGKDTVPVFEKSYFESEVTALADGDEKKMEEILSSCYDLSEFVVIKPYDELKKRFDEVMGFDTSVLPDAETMSKDRKEFDDLSNSGKEPDDKKQKHSIEKTEGTVTDNSDDLSYFESLLK